MGFFSVMDYFQGVVVCGLAGIGGGIFGEPFTALAVGGVCIFNVVVTYHRGIRRADDAFAECMKECEESTG